jgi:hypothetical protein
MWNYLFVANTSAANASAQQRRKVASNPSNGLLENRATFAQMLTTFTGLACPTTQATSAAKYAETSSAAQRIEQFALDQTARELKPSL